MKIAGQFYIQLLALILLLPSFGRAADETLSTVGSSPNISHEIIPKNTSKEYKREYQGEVGFALLGRRYDDPVVNSRFGILMITLNLEARYRDWLMAKLSLLQLSSSGTQSALYSVTEGVVPNVLIVPEASINVLPFRGVLLSAGILDIKFSPIISQFFNQNNVGFKTQIQAKGSAGTIALIGSQSMPKSDESNRILDEDTSPLLTVGMLYGELPFDGVGFTVKASATRYIFTDLSSNAADSSLKRGSSTVANGPNGSLFLYEFRGNEFALALSQEVGRADLISLKGSVIKNELAPNDLNSGWQAKVEYKKVVKNFALLPSYTRFRLDPDALPALYANFLYGFANRDGDAYNLKVDFPKEKLSFFAGYIKANVAVPTAASAQYQADREIYSIGAEAKYDLF